MAADRPTPGSASARRADPVAVREFLDGQRLDTLLARDLPVLDQLRSTADALADLHARARRRSDERVTRAVGADALLRRWALDVGRARRHGDLFDHASLVRIAELAGRFVTGRRPLLARRLALGTAVRGHGDLRVTDVHCLPAGPRLRERPDIDERARRLDQLEDAAALAVDLEVAGRADLGQWFLDRYEESAAVPVAPPSLRHHLLARRAFVRAVGLAQGRRSGAGPADAGRLASIALRHLELGEVRLTLVGGPGGVDRARLAATLAALTGAELVRAGATSDVLDTAEHALELGTSVVAEATWSGTDERRAVTAVARRTASRLVALNCRARPGDRPENAAPAGVWPGAIAVNTGRSADATLLAALDAMTTSADGRDVPGPGGARAARPGADGSKGTTAAPRAR